MAQIKNVDGEWYSARFHEPSLLLKIVAKRSGLYYFVPIVSACDQPGKRDVHRHLSNFATRKTSRGTVLTFTETSTLWDRKEYRIEFSPRQIRYSYKVFGHGPVSRAYFFRSWMNDPITVEEELGSVPCFDTVFSPAVNFWGKVYHFPGDTSIITTGDEHSYWGAGLVAAPYCFALGVRGQKPWMWAGLALRAGQYTFDEFTYNSNETRRIFGPGGFDCNYAGKLHIDGQWQSPEMVIGLADGPYEAIEDYIAMLEKDYGLKLPRKKKIPQWWKSPIFCGWGEQMSLGFRDHGNVEGVQVGVYCTQANHDLWLDILRRHKIRPGQIIIDAGWQKDGTSGDMYVDEQKWPDLRGWIEQRRKEGIRTILWMMAWDRAGVPDDECMTCNGQAVNVDPTNPRYEKRLRAMIRRMVSSEPGCYNADGVKIDGEMNLPLGEGLTNCENLWGLELQRRWMSIVYNEVKKHKPDGLVGTFMANPYLAEFNDVVRTADMFSIHGSPDQTLIHRARLLSIVHPNSPIDTDHTYWYDVRDNWIDIHRTQVKVGVPCMYHAQYVFHKRPFVRPYIEEMTRDHYRQVRKAFDAQWRRIGAK